MGSNIFRPATSQKARAFSQSSHGVRNPGIGFVPVNGFGYQMGFQPAYVNTVANYFSVTGFMFKYTPSGGPAFYNPAFVNAATANGIGFLGGPANNVNLPLYSEIPSTWLDWDVLIKTNPKFEGGQPPMNCIVSGLAGSNLAQNVNILGGGSVGGGGGPLASPVSWAVPGLTSGVASTYSWVTPLLGNMWKDAPTFYFNNGSSGQTQWLDPIIPGTYQISLSGGYSFQAGLYTSSGNISVFAVCGKQQILLSSIAAPSGAWAPNNFNFSSTAVFGNNNWFILVKQNGMGGDLSNLIWVNCSYSPVWYNGAHFDNPATFSFGRGAAGPANWAAMQVIAQPPSSFYFTGTPNYPFFGAQTLIATASTMSFGGPDADSFPVPGWPGGVPIPGFNGTVNGERIGP